MDLPFDVRYLDALMDEGGIDLLLATDKDTVQYLTGGYRFFFFAHKDAIGVSRYMPALGYPKGQPEKAFYIGHGLEPQIAAGAEDLSGVHARIRRRVFDAPPRRFGVHRTLTISVAGSSPSD